MRHREYQRLERFANLFSKFLVMNQKIGKQSEQMKQTPTSRSGDAQHSTTRYMRAAANFDKSKFKKTGLPDRCFKLLQKYSEVSISVGFQVRLRRRSNFSTKLLQHRNKFAHETEHTIAKLLLKQEHQLLHHLWEHDLVFCYNKSLEELAGVERVSD